MSARIKEIEPENALKNSTLYLSGPGDSPISNELMEICTSVTETRNPKLV